MGEYSQRTLSQFWEWDKVLFAHAPYRALSQIFTIRSGESQMLRKDANEAH